MLPNSSKVRFLRGDQETSWPELAATNLIARNIFLIRGIDSRFLANALKPFDRPLHFWSQRVQHILQSFLDNLRMFRCTECSYPRDTVYAPLCLALDEVRCFIKSDYAAKTGFNTYIDVARYYVAQSGHELNNFGHALYQEEMREVKTPKGIKSVLPPWVPDFSALTLTLTRRSYRVTENLEMLESGGKFARGG